MKKKVSLIKKLLIGFGILFLIGIIADSGDSVSYSAPNKEPINMDNELHYNDFSFAWYSNTSREKYSGPVFYVDENNKKIEMILRDGKIWEGKWTDWHKKWTRSEKGLKSREYTIKDGSPDGKMTWWYENGQKSKVETYKDKEMISKECWDWHGNEYECDSTPPPFPQLSEAPPGKVWSPEHNHWHDDDEE